jgi:hypothetical protein
MREGEPESEGQSEQHGNAEIEARRAALARVFGRNIGKMAGNRRRVSGWHRAPPLLAIATFRGEDAAAPVSSSTTFVAKKEAS